MTNLGLKHLSRKDAIRFYDRIMYIVAFAYPASTLPQIAKIFIEKNAESIAVSSWLTMILFALTWMIYGTVHKDWPIVISNFLWISSYVAVVGGVVLYG